MKTHDLFERRGSPQTPCPLVHPFPNFVPNPTIKPDTTNPKIDTPFVYFDLESYKSLFISNILLSVYKNALAINIETKNKYFYLLFSSLETTPHNIPLKPAIEPLK